jgi:hypothetical protein
MTKLLMPRTSAHRDLPSALQNIGSSDTWVTITKMDMLLLYLYDLFQAKIDRFGDGGTNSAEVAASVFPPDSLSLEAAVDCEQLSTLLAQAYRTPSMCIVLELLLVEYQFYLYAK